MVQELVDRLIAKLEDPRTRIRIGSETRAPATPNEKAVLDALDEDGLFQQICHASGLDPRTAARTLHFLQLTGHVQIERDRSMASLDFTTAEDDLVREAVALHLKLVFELIAPLVALDGAEAVVGRLDQILEESAAHGRSLLDGVTFDPNGSLDPRELEYRALRLPGDRIREVNNALGEIIAYLEFELKNHPKIEDSGPFLEAVDPLRAMLIR